MEKRLGPGNGEDTQQGKFKVGNRLMPHTRDTLGSFKGLWALWAMWGWVVMVRSGSSWFGTGLVYRSWAM